MGRAEYPDAIYCNGKMVRGCRSAEPGSLFLTDRNAEVSVTVRGRFPPKWSDSISSVIERTTNAKRAHGFYSPRRKGALWVFGFVLQVIEILLRINSL